MTDEGFHEIQLNGKQLVFLFMFATVVSVGIFLCGVMVGRGVRAERGDQSAQTTELPSGTAATPTTPPPSVTPSSPAPAGKGQPPAPPEPAEDDYYKSLTAQKPEDESLKGAAKTKPAALPAESPKPAHASASPAPATTPPPPEKSKAAPAPVADQSQPAAVTSGGFAVQITALRDRGEADAIVKRLVTKGYPAYVLNPLPGKPPVYRVQVGRYKNRSDADRIAGRLKKEEQFSPWVTR
jgi:cell division septation protein DedD